MSLHIETRNGPLDLPVTADPAEGGLVLEHPAPPFPVENLTGVVRGKWGFDDWEGPRFHLISAEPGKWSVPSSDQSALVVGREDTLHIDGGNTLCVDKVEEAPASGDALPLTWKSPQAGDAGGGGADERCRAGAGKDQCPRSSD